MKPTNQRKLQEAIRQYVKKDYSGNIGPVQLGDLFVFPGLPGDCFLSFAVISPHPDNEGNSPHDLFVIAPVDSMGGPLVGACDVVEDNYYFNRIVAKLGYTFWAERKNVESLAGEQLTEGRPRLGEEMVRHCRKRLHELATGKLNPTKEQLITIMK